jgi:aminomuconate-semialdehyde/2-hydroxymuconate-6-semialdehyde dehydrogenase
LDRLLNHIGGEGRAPHGDGWMPNVNPATGEVLCEIPASTAEDVDAAVAAARAAQPAWAAVSVQDRAKVLDRIANRLEAELPRLARLESEDSGKTVRLASAMDIPRAVMNFRFFAGAARHDETGATEYEGALNYALRRPIGVVGLITPWNLPLYLLSWKVAPALAMGNTIVAKPSELTPRTAAALATITAEEGLPAGVFNLVHGLGPDVGEPLVRHPDVRAVSFTGGTATGARVAAAAGAKKLSLELGGKNPTVVFADCDFDATIEGVVRSSFTNQGQICLCGSRILVERSIYERFVDALVARVRKLVVGPPDDPASDLGSLSSFAHREKVEGYLRLAAEEGGRIRVGGDRPQGLAGAFLAPAVVTDLPPTCRFAQEEIFGPVVSVHPFDDETEAIAIANGVKYGLSATVWTRDLGRAHRVSAALEVGLVWVNTWLVRDLRVPFGGVKASGHGREGGRYSLDFYSELKNVTIRW